MIFPYLRSSHFQTHLLKLSPDRLEASPNRPRPPEALGIIPVFWPAYFEGSDWVQELGTNMQGMFDRAEDAKRDILKTHDDRRYTNEGAKARNLELVQSFLTGYTPKRAYSPKEALELIERHSARLLSQVEGLAPAPVDRATAAEWRALVRSSGATPVERLAKMRDLMRDGNADVAPAVLAAGHGLSGIAADHHQALSLYVRAASNLDEFGRLWIEAEALDSLRLGVVRSVSVLADRAALPLEPRQALDGFTSAVPVFQGLTATLEKLDGAVGMFSGAGLSYEQQEAATA